MDAPKTTTFEELQQLAEDRNAWKRLVERTFGKEGSAPRRLSPPPKLSVRAKFTLNANTTNTRANPPKSKYQQRDEHQMFFLRNDKDRAKRQRQKKKKIKIRPLTNKERQAAARAHWEANHAADADWTASKATTAAALSSALATVFSSDSETSLEVAKTDGGSSDSDLGDMGFVPKHFDRDKLFSSDQRRQPRIHLSADAPTFVPSLTSGTPVASTDTSSTSSSTTQINNNNNNNNELNRRQTMRRLHEMRQAKLRRRRNQKHLTQPGAVAATTPPTTPTTMTLSPAAPNFSPTTSALTLSVTAPPFTPTKTTPEHPAVKFRSDLWAEAAQPPSPTPSSIHLTPTSTSSQELWAEPAAPPSPTPSSINLSHSTLNPSNYSNSPTTPNHSNTNSPNSSIFDTWPPISPIHTHDEPHTLSMIDTFTHTPNNHFLNELTIINETYMHVIHFI